MGRAPAGAACNIAAQSGGRTPAARWVRKRRWRARRRSPAAGSRRLDGGAVPPGSFRRGSACARQGAEGTESGGPPDRHPLNRGTTRPGGHEEGARLGSARLGSARLGSARLGSARLGSARLGSARLGSARLGSARLGSARLGSARLGSARLNYTFCGIFRHERIQRHPLATPAERGGTLPVAKRSGQVLDRCENAAGATCRARAPPSAKAGISHLH